MLCPPLPALRPRPCPRSIVHLCLRKADQKLVILKQIPVEQMSKDERLAAQNECQVLKLLSHPNVIEYYENFLEDKALMIAMEYAPGGPCCPPVLVPLQVQGVPSTWLSLGQAAVVSRCAPCKDPVLWTPKSPSMSLLNRHFCRKVSGVPGGHQVDREPSAQALVQAAQRGYGVTTLGDTQKRGPETGQSQWPCLSSDLARSLPTSAIP